jgi:hypothetical protein
MLGRKNLKTYTGQLILADDHDIKMSNDFENGHTYPSQPRTTLTTTNATM